MVSERMKKPRFHIEERRPHTIQRADIPPAAGYAMVVDGHFKAEFVDEVSAMKDAAELLKKFPMLKIEVYDASSKARTLVK
jgi:hypothetical protein